MVFNQSKITDNKGGGIHVEGDRGLDIKET